MAYAKVDPHLALLYLIVRLIWKYYGGDRIEIISSALVFDLVRTYLLNCGEPPIALNNDVFVSLAPND